MLRALFLLLVLAALCLAQPALAATDFDTGNTGANGLDAASPGETGGVGTTGGGANASVSTPDALNNATSRGGRGGIGGGGGQGTAASPDGGDGGQGGDGGAATADASTPMPQAGTQHRVVVSATGGVGGGGGVGGAAGPGGSDGVQGDGGRGGDADASGEIQSTTSTATSQGSAVGGRGGAGRNGGDGGDATNSTVAEGSFDFATATASAIPGSLSALGGAGGSGIGGSGGDGGNATSETRARSTSSRGRARATDRATGGVGGDLVAGSGAIIGVAGRGGDASSRAVAEQTSFGSANAMAIGGAGGNALSNRIGDGGDGGNASASALASDNRPGERASASAVATAGRGGLGFGVGQSGGDGGTATASVRVEAPTSNSANVEATGGRGGEGRSGAEGGDGGDAILKDAASGATTSTLSVRQTATGGVGGAATAAKAGDGGAATSTGDFRNDGGITATLIATGGDAGAGADTAGSGRAGDAEAGGSATAIGNAAARIDAIATGGAGVLGTDGGVGTAMAEAHSGTGRVTVRVDTTGGAGGSNTAATGGNGGTAQLSNAVGGTTDGELSLSQDARGGNGGSGQTGGAGGDASSTSDFQHRGAGPLDLRVNAIGGQGGRSSRGSAFDGESGAAHASARGEGAGEVRVEAEAVGRATLGPVFGRSTGGRRVTVHGSIEDSSGSDVVLENAVDGATSGGLSLLQNVAGKAAVSSRLDHSGTFGALSVNSDARSIADRFIAGETVRSEARAENLGGAATATGSATASNGGNAELVLEAITHRDGDAVSVGRSFRGEAVGGNGLSVSSTPPAGNGTTMATGTALGDATVDVRAVAEGGRALFTGTQGGSATARAVGSNQGASKVSVAAEAEGGDSAAGADGGMATASAHGSSVSGTVDVRVLQLGGNASFSSTQQGGRGADSTLVNAATGTTSGELVIEQVASGGAGGRGMLGGDGGDASSSLDVSHAGRGLNLNAVATGGGAGSASSSVGTAGHSGAGSASARGEAAGDVFVRASASGDASLGTVLARSTDGGEASAIGVLVQREAGSVTLDNLVEAESSGIVRFTQDVTGGIGGDVVNRVQRSASADEMHATVNSKADRSGGGDISSTAILENLTGSASALASAQAEAGGNARVEQRATSTGDGKVVTVGDSRSFARGGDGVSGRLAGGSASSLSVAVANGDSSVSVSDFARGGRGNSFGTTGGSGGDAASRAEGSNTGSSTVRVISGATGGDGGGGFDGGAATASAHGTSLSGDVVVEVTQSGGRGGRSLNNGASGRGADSHLDNAATGTTQGDLSLKQIARGGSGGDGSTAADGGDASSLLDITSGGSGLIQLDASAMAGLGGRSFSASPGGKAGDANASAVAEGAGDVTVSALADGFNASLGPVSARSTAGGDVHVTATLTSRSSSPLVLDNLADGQTTGGLTLEQNVSGGPGADVTNRISRVGSWDRVSARATSSTTFVSGTVPGAGGNLSSEVDLENLTGAVDANARATARDGGSATLFQRGVSSGDFHDVRIGQNQTGAIGGGGISAAGRLDGGDATSRSIGIANGNSRVSVRDSAVGVDAAAFGGVVGLGGDATSSATGSNQGAERVDVEANANGGAGAVGGTAKATARGTSSSGNVQVTASQRGGTGQRGSGSADGGDGAGSHMADAASGSTGGDLALFQTATAGAGGDGRSGGNGGDASSTLDVNHTGRNLVLSARALAGNAGRAQSGVGTAGQAGTAFASASGEAAGDVGITAVARGDASLGTVFGRSTGGGEVEVRATLEGLTGSDLVMDNVADGVTTGSLELRQVLRVGPGADGTNRIQQSGSWQSLLLETDTGDQTTATGSGGDLLSEIDAANQTGSVSATAKAQARTGGDATVVVNATTGGDGSTISVGTPSTFFTGAVGGGVSSRALTARAGGDATSSSSGIAHGNSRVSVHDGASAGAGGPTSGGSVGGAGGNASSHATGSNQGNESVTVSARASGGSGGRGANGGSGSASAQGSSIDGDVAVTVRQSGGNGNQGADSHLAEAASGDTTANLSLVQEATAGDSVAIGIQGGSASSTLDREHTGSGDLSLVANAEAGFGGANASWGDSFASARGVGNADVSVQASSEGNATLGAVYGESTSGGDVEVFATLSDRRGGDLVLDDVANGITTGDLTLGQHLVAAAGGSGTNRLRRSGAWSRLSGSATSGGHRSNTQSNTAAGSDLHSEIDLENTAGRVSAFANAFAEDGGDASVVQRATSTRDGDNVNVGQVFGSLFGAVGGSGSTSSIAPARVGGDATSVSEGIALGDASVSVRDRATGGAGSGSGTNGGNASSNATGSNQGDATVMILAEAFGGTASRGGDGGTATASAHGASLTGAVDVQVRQTGGDGASSFGTGLSGRGADSHLIQEATGSTLGDLTLRQFAEGGRGEGGSPGGDGGDASSVLDVVHGGQDLTLISHAFGGAAGTGGAIGSGHAAANGEALGDVTIDVAAGGVPSFGPVFGRSSGGGRVDVRAHAEGSNGADLLIDTVVDGETSGALSLRQSALGVGGNVVNRFARSTSGSGPLSITLESSAQSGSNLQPEVLSELDVVHAGSSLTTNVRANGVRDGEARVAHRAETLGDGRELLATTRAIGATSSSNSGNVVGGFAANESTAIAAGDSAVVLEASAIGGLGGRRFDGGDAEVNAVGSNQGSSVVQVVASGAGGNGNEGGHGGSAVGSASGSSLDGHVSVSLDLRGGRGGGSSFVPIGGAGGSVDVRNAITGTTDGELELSQTASGGDGGRGSEGGSGGDAVSMLDVVHLGSGPLRVSAAALAGIGGSARTAGSPNGRDGNAMVSARGEASGDVHVSARTNREGGLGAVFGRSTGGGRVDVSAILELQAGSGSDVALHNFVDGDTTGVLALRQEVRAGFSSLVGLGVEASSTLDRSVSLEGLELFTTAVSRDGLGAGRAGTAASTAHNETGHALADADAVGGSSRGDDGNGVVSGGVAEALARATTGGDHAATASARSTGGRGSLRASGGVVELASVRGGDANSEAVASTGEGPVSVRSVAIGGQGGFIQSGNAPLAGRGGDAHASGHGEATGSGDVTVYVQSTAGDAGSLFSGAATGEAGDATLSASGRSDSGSVSVTAVLEGGGGGVGGFLSIGSLGNGAMGGDAALHNAVSGETSGDLTLVQEVRGGSGGGSVFAAGGPGGRAESTLDVVHLTGGALDIAADARAGAGGFGEPGADGGDAHASAVGVGAGNVRVRASSSGGAGGPTIRGAAVGTAGVGSLGRVFGASTQGGDVYVIGESSSGGLSGGDVVLFDAVRGETSGALTLEQNARSGGGFASSRLRRRDSIEALRLVTLTEGVDAHATANARNDAGDATAHVLSVATTGDARSEARARASREGASVVIGMEGALGEAAKTGARTFGSGSATSVSIGRHDGDGTVTVIDRAEVETSFLAFTVPGSANSRAVALNAGASKVVARSTARGGNGTVFFGAFGGGEATSDAMARGLGEVEATARSIGGVGFVAGGATSKARGSGRSGSASAEATVVGLHGVTSFFSQSMVARASADVADDARVIAQAFEASLGSVGAGQDAFALASLSPDAALLAEWSASAPAVIQQIQDQRAQVVALGRVGANAFQDADISLEAGFELAGFRDPANGVRARSLIVGFVDHFFSGEGLGLRLTIDRNGEEVLDIAFDDGEEADSWLTGRTLVLGRGQAEFGIPELEIVFAWEGDGSGEGARIDFVVAVPEPAIGLLVLIGIGLGIRRARRC